MHRVVWAAGMWLVCAGGVALAEEAVPKAPEVLSEAAESVEHLLKAAEHLEAAGLIEEAARIREQARERAAGSKLLARKEAELQCLQEEVLRLRDLAGQSQAILVRAVVLEVDLAALGERKAEFDRLLGRSRGQKSPVEHADLAPAGASLQEILDHPLVRKLRDQGALPIRTLVEPTLITVPGRPASFFSGGQIPVPVRGKDNVLTVNYKPFGTQLEVVPAVMPGGRLHLQARLELTERQLGRAVEIVPGYPTDEISQICSVNTEVEITPGEAVVLGTFSSATSTQPSPSIPAVPKAARELIVLLTAEMANGPARRAPQEIIPVREDVSEVPLRYSPHDIEYFPAGPVVPVLPRSMRK